MLLNNRLGCLFRTSIFLYSTPGNKEAYGQENGFTTIYYIFNKFDSTCPCIIGTTIYQIRETRYNRGVYNHFNNPMMLFTPAGAQYLPKLYPDTVYIGPQ
jgi:hypothetical protein